MSQPWPDEPDPLDPASDTGSLSPRTTLLTPPMQDGRRLSRGPSSKFRHARERAHSTASARDLLRLLIDEEYESQQARKLLYTAFERLEHETHRADAAEARIEETIQRARAINEAWGTARQQASQAQEELKMYKLQLENAQNEILRAQEILKAIEAQRDQAEAAAASARDKARRMNQERLIDSAREEGRRLGFEEGVRRGRRMGYREAHSAGSDDWRHEMQQVATTTVNRLIEERDEPEQIEIIEEPTPIPPPSSARTPPEVHRIETPISSSLENQRPSSRSRRDSGDSVSRSTSTRRRAPDRVVIPGPEVDEPRIGPRTPSTPTASRAPRPRSGSQSWTGPPVEPAFGRPISIQNSPPGVRHSGYHVPPDNYIPTVDENHNITLPPPHEMQRNIPSPTPSQHTLGPASERGRRDYTHDNYPPHRRGSPDGSLASTKQSAASTISQLDLLGLPIGAKRRERSHGLSVIHEDASSRSDRMTDYSQTIASETGRNSFREMGSSETLRRDKDRKSKQQLADELRYSDPSAAEQWRRDNSRSQPLDGPPRHRPPHVTIPTPLSPLQRPDSRHHRTPSERQGRAETRSEYRDHHRLSSDSSVPEISVVPPSRSPSDAPSRGRGNAYGLLSPDHAHQPLPVPAPPASSNQRAVPGSPGRRANGEEIYTVLSDGQLPPGFLPSPTAHAPQAPARESTPTQRYAVPAVPRAASSTDRETVRSRSPISFYAAAPVPSGVTYPAPPISRSAGYGAVYAASNPSAGSEGRRRRDSLSATAGMTPAARAKPIAVTNSDGGSVREGRARSGSVGSLTRRPSYSRYDPDVYNDPAYLANNDSFVDSVTDANTAANGGRRAASPAYSFATLRTNE